MVKLKLNKIKDVLLVPPRKNVAPLVLQLNLLTVVSDGLDHFGRPEVVEALLEMSEKPLARLGPELAVR